MGSIASLHDLAEMLWVTSLELNEVLNLLELVILALRLLLGHDLIKLPVIGQVAALLLKHLLLVLDFVRSWILVIRPLESI